MKKVQNPLNKLNLKFKHAKFILAFIAFGFIGCAGGGGVGDGLKCGNGDWAQSIEKELNNYLDALGTYSNDQSSQNCQNLKQSLLGYIKALKGIKKCVPTSSISIFTQSLEQAEKDVNDLDC